MDSGAFAFRIERYAAVLSRDRGVALLREIAKLEKFESEAVATLDAAYRDV